MLKPLLTLLDLPSQVTAAISIVSGSMLLSVLGVLAQIGGQASAIVQEAPSWFLGFVALVVVALGWAVLVLARYAATTQRTSNEQVAASIAQQTTVLHELGATIALQNQFWQNAGLEMVRRAVDGDLPAPPPPPPAVNLHARPMRATSTNKPPQA